MQRTLKYVKYLPALGFQPTVIAGSPGWRYFAHDSTLLGDVPPGVTVLRVRELPVREALWACDELRRRLALPARRGSPLWPDEMTGWLPGALWHALRVTRASRPDVLYSTSSPGTDHLVALIISRLTGLPWVADFRDGWTQEPLGLGESGYRMADRASMALEEQVVRHATRVTVACESISLRGLSDRDPRRVMIRNGVDPDDLRVISGVRHEPDPDRFRLSYVGSLRPNQGASPLFAAIRELIQRGAVPAERLEVRIVGNVALPRASFASLPVTCTGYVDHLTALAEMVAADVLLLSLPPQHPGSTGKIYEYLASGRPILCAAHPDGAAAHLVRELDAGVCADVRDTRQIVAALEGLLSEWRAGSLSVDPAVKEEALRRFSRPKLAADLAQVLREAANAAPGP